MDTTSWRTWSIWRFVLLTTSSGGSGYELKSIPCQDGGYIERWKAQMLKYGKERESSNCSPCGKEASVFKPLSEGGDRHKPLVGLGSEGVSIEQLIRHALPLSSVVLPGSTLRSIARPTSRDPNPSSTSIHLNLSHYQAWNIAATRSGPRRQWMKMKEVPHQESLGLTCCTVAQGADRGSLL